jgi:hypothetical protein
LEIEIDDDKDGRNGGSNLRQPQVDMEELDVRSDIEEADQVQSKIGE